MANTPNMDLDLPVVGATLGPDYAEKNNSAFEDIDVHDHTTGNGVRVPTSGLNINASLSFAGFSAEDLEAATFSDISGTAIARSVYVDGGELYFKDSSNNSVQITVGGSIAGTPGSISNLGDGGSSAVYSDLAEDFSWYFTGTSLAAFNVGDIRLFPFDGINPYTQFITLKAQTSLATAYTLTLPNTLPAATSFVQVSAAGILSYTNTPANPILASLGTAALPSYSFTGDTDTGIYSSGANTLNLSTGGTSRLALSTTELTSAVAIRAPDGTAAAPGVSLTTDASGLFRVSSGVLGLSVSGSSRATFSLNEVVLQTSLLKVGTFGTTAIEAGTINLSGGGAFKVKFVTISSGLATTFGNAYFPSAAHGLTGSSIRSVIIGKYLTASSRGYSSGYDGDSASNGSHGGVLASWNSTNISAEFIERDASGTWALYATIFYV